MANENRRLKRIIQQAVREFEKSGVTLPLRRATAAQEKAFKQQMQLRVKQITEQLKTLAKDATRYGHKRRLALWDELDRVGKMK